MQDCAAILDAAAKAAGARSSSCRGRTADPFAAPERLTRRRGVPNATPASTCSATLDGPARPDRDALANAARAAGIRVAADDTWSDVFSRVLVERIEPKLGHRARRRCSSDYPVAEAALARSHDGDPRVAERFELYVCGVELANAFGELTDPARAAPALRGGDGTRSSGSTASAIRSTRISSPRSRRCRRRAASRSASIGW